MNSFLEIVTEEEGDLYHYNQSGECNSFSKSLLSTVGRTKLLTFHCLECYVKLNLQF